MTQMIRESVRCFHRIVVRYAGSFTLDRALVLGTFLCAALMLSGCSGNPGGPSPIPTPPEVATPTPTPAPPTPTPATPTPTPETPTPTPAPFKVTDVTVSAVPATYSGSCPKSVKFEGAIEANGTGHVEYRWESESGEGVITSYNFAHAGVKYVEMTQTLSNSKSGWIRLRILFPNSAVSNKANFDVECKGKVTAVSLIANPPVYFGACPMTAKFVGSITVDNPTTVVYQFIQKSTATSPSQTLVFTSAGTKAVSYSWKTNKDGWVELRTVSPNVMTSAKASFSIACFPLWP